jgi:hypothetical protein
VITGKEGVLFKLFSVAQELAIIVAERAVGKCGSEELCAIKCGFTKSTFQNYGAVRH